MHRLFTVLFTVLALGLLAGCGSHRNLGFEVYGSAPNQRYVCKSGAPSCEKSASDGPIDEDTSHTTFFMLPSKADCPGGVHKILVKNADSAHPDVIVTCASP